MSAPTENRNPSALEGAWIEIFRAGDYADRGAWSTEDLDHVSAAYDPRLQPAPVVLGHPAEDAPAYGWVKRLRRAGQSLWAQLEKVDPAFEALLRAGRFRQRSVSLYRQFPSTGGPYLRHLGFLGAAAPAVKGLAPVRFADAAAVSFSFDNPTETEIAMPEQKSTLETFMEHLRSFFSSGDIAAEPAIVQPSEEVAFSDRLAALEQRLDALTSEKSSTENTSTNDESDHGRQQVAAFVESLRRRGRFPPVFDRWGVAEFLDRLSALEQSSSSETITVRFGEEADAQEAGLSAWFQDFLAKLPAVIDFAELTPGAARRSPATGPRSPVVRFTEPARGMSVDPASVELAERAEALATERGLSYAQALAQLREDHRSAPTSA